MRKRTQSVVVGLLVAATGLIGSALLPSAAAAQTLGYNAWNPGFIGFPPGTPERPRANCAGASNACIDRTLGEMWRRFHRYIPNCNHNAVFSLTYIRVTEDVRSAVDQGFYPDLRWITRQDAMFARIYFLTYRAWRAGRTDLVPDSWRLAFANADQEGVAGIGNLLLAMNAHVNRDFPFILYHAGLTNRDGSSKKPQHDTYNDRLHALYKPMLTELAHRFDASIDDYDVPGLVADDDSFFQILVQWREAAWQNATRLADAKTDAERRQVAQSIEAYATSVAQSIIAGSQYAPGQDAALRDARCARFGGQIGPTYSRAADTARPSGGRARLGARDRLVIPLECPSGPGDCRGTVRVRTPWHRRGADSFAIAGKKVFGVPLGGSRSVVVPLGPLEAKRLAARSHRGVWVGIRSKLAPGEGVTRRWRLRLDSGGRRGA